VAGKNLVAIAGKTKAPVESWTEQISNNTDIAYSYTLDTSGYCLIQQCETENEHPTY
jgi:hypothetical protein